MTQWQDWIEVFTTKGGTLSGELNMTNGINIRRMQSGSSITQRLYPMGDVIGDSYTVGIERLVNGVGESAFQFNRHGAMIKDSANSKYYKIYSEHNVTRGTTDITSGSALATGCIHLVYE
jgi:hypothetical protein